MGTKTRKITREQYESYLKRKGYCIEGDTAVIDTPYGKWIERIEETNTGFCLKTITNPVSKKKEKTT